MTVENTNPIQHFTANGETTVFAISFAVEGKDNIKVTVNGSVVSVNDYSYDALTKAVVFNAAPVEGAEVVVERVTSLDRSINYQTYDNSFRPETLNYDLDRIWHVLQEDKVTDAEILARIKDEIEWRRTHDNEWDLLAQAREQGLFNALKSYMDTIGAMSVPNLFDGITDNVVITEEGVSQRVTNRGLKQAQAELLEALNSLNGTVNVNLAEAKTYTDDEKARAVAEETRISNSLVAETNRATDAESVLQSQINALGVGNKAYKTYAEMVADQANIQANSKITVTNDTDTSKNGDYQFDGTVFTKSSYDVLTLSKNYTQEAISEIDVNLLEGLSLTVAQAASIKKVNLGRWSSHHITANGTTSNGIVRYALVRGSITNISAGLFLDYSETGIEPTSVSVNVSQTATGTSVNTVELSFVQLSTYLRYYYINNYDCSARDYLRLHIILAVGNTASVYLPKIVVKPYLKYNTHDLDVALKQDSTELKTVFSTNLLESLSPTITQACAVQPTNMFNVSGFTLTSTGTTSSAIWIYYSPYTEVGKYSAGIRIDYSEVGIAPNTVNIAIADGNTGAGTNSQSLSYIQESEYCRFYFIEEYEVNSILAMIRFRVIMPLGSKIFVSYAKISKATSLTYSPSEITKQLSVTMSEDGSNSSKESRRDIAEASIYIKNPISTGALRLVAGELVDTKADFTNFSVWGSSSAAAMHGHFSTLSAELGCTNFTGGAKGGERIPHHSARMGARPAKICFTEGIIPSSTIPIEVLHNLGSKSSGLAQLKAFTGIVNGVLGTLSYSADTTSGIVFTRASEGEAVVLDSTLYYSFIPETNSLDNAGYGVLWVGKNDIGWSAMHPEEILQRTIEMYSYYKAAFPRVLVVGLWANSSWEGWKLNACIQLNTLLKEHFGDYFVDINTYLMSPQIWMDSGIAPTNVDLAQQKTKNLPSSLSSDGQHLSSAINALIVTTVFRPKMIQLGWLEA